MRRTIFGGVATALLVVLASAGTASAGPVSFTMTATVGGAPMAGTILDNLDWLSLGAGGGTSPQSGIIVSFGTGILPGLGGQAVTGFSVNVYAAPYLSGSNGIGFGNSPVPGSDTSIYISSGSTEANTNPNANFEILLPHPNSYYFGLLWGSIDWYNTLSFYDGLNLLFSVTGTDVDPNANGSQGLEGTRYVNFTSDTPFNRVVATSSITAFEIDNVAVVASPEPASMVLFGTGLVALAGVARRRMRKQ